MTESLRILIAATVLTASGAAGSERRVELKDLPARVQEAVREQTKGAKLLGLSEEIDAGKTVYEAETSVDGRARDILIDATGAVLEIEEEVPLSSIPQAARSALERVAGGGKVQEVESVTKGGATSYEATIKENGKESKVSVTSDGTIRNE